MRNPESRQASRIWEREMSQPSEPVQSTNGALSAADAVRQDDLCSHIFSVSATLVGACLTVIGLLHALKRDSGAGTYADDVLTLDALLFLIACVTAYRALRTVNAERRQFLEKAADKLFFPALLLMLVACVIITYDLV